MAARTSLLALITANRDRSHRRAHAAFRYPKGQTTKTIALMRFAQSASLRSWRISLDPAVP